VPVLPANEAAPIVDAPAVHTIDLEIALRLGGVENPTINLARERVREALAGQTAARALLLPSVNVGGNLRLHRGVLITSAGLIRDVNSQSLYLGAGAAAIGGNPVAIPGVQLFANLGDAVYEPLAARQRTTTRRAESQAVQNAILLEVTLAYLRLIEAENRREILRSGMEEASEIVRLTAAHAKAGQGRQADADRAAANAQLFERELRRAEEDVAVASAGLCRLLSLDPSVRLQTAAAFPQPIHLIPEDAELESLVQEALQARPELLAGSAAIAEAQTRTRQQRARPLLPTLSVGYSAGGFGGGSNLQPSDFGPLMGRSNFDVFAVWNVQNLGFGNRAQIRRADATLGATIAAYDAAVNQVRREVTEAASDARAAALQVKAAETAVKTAEEGYALERERIRQAQGRPIEALDSLRQLIESHQELVRAVIAYDAAQFRLFVALGNNPCVEPAPAPAE
jgi:outer membrane protein TolC